MFAYVGSMWRQGGLPYRDAWDVKLPGIYAVYALVGGAEWGPRFLDLFALAITVMALLRIDRIRACEEPEKAPVGLLATVLAVVYTLGACDFWNLAQTETLIAPLSMLAVALALSRRPLAAGLLAGCAAMIKTTAAVAVFPVLLCCWLPELVPRQAMSRGGMRSVSGRGAWLTVVGWTIPPTLGLGYFAARGGLPYLAELVSTQREYAAGDPRLSGSSPFQLIGGLGLTGYLPLVAASALGVCLAVARQFRAGYGRQMSAEWVLLAWWGIALAQVVVQRRFYLYHWAVLTPPAAWFAAELIATGWTCRARLPGLRMVILGISTGALVFAVAPRWPTWRWAGEVLVGRMSVVEFQGRHTGVFGYDVRFARQAAQHVRKRSRPGDPLLVLAFEPEVYLYSDRRAPTRHASEAPLFGETSISEERRRSWFAELMSDVHHRPPLYVVDRDVPHRRPEWSRPLFAWIEHDYRQEATYGPFRVYRRVSAPGS